MQEGVQACDNRPLLLRGDLGEFGKVAFETRLNQRGTPTEFARLNENGFEGDWIERQLAHSGRNDVRAAYHARYLPERRRMMQRLEGCLDQTIGA